MVEISKLLGMPTRVVAVVFESDVFDDEELTENEELQD
jgi:hypothetical protein